MKSLALKTDFVKPKSCIDEMESLLNQIDDFKKLLDATENVSNPEYKQEYRLFKQHVEWVIEDLCDNIYIASPKVESKVS